MTDFLPADLDKVITALSTIPYPCQSAVTLAIVDDRGTGFASGLIEGMLEDGIIALVGNTVHPCLVPIKSCVTCGWKPGTFPVSHLTWYMGLGTVAQHFYSHREDLFT